MKTRWSGQISSLQRVCFDSNAIIYALESVEPYALLVGRALKSLEERSAISVISTIVVLETLVKPMKERDQEAIDEIEHFFRVMPNLLVRPMDGAVARSAAAIRARTQLPTPDAIIVATALEERCDAIIGNDSYMAHQVKGIPYLYLEDYV
ncbi:MAG: type II toxin-antitoxin system VapC family toxin [Chloroflexi bacterium]|nr:type II toxin-antitoxin system VapC family toxin [Chloroflexota bacterium]